MKSTLRFILSFASGAAMLPCALHAQAPSLKSFALTGAGSPSSILPSNSISHLAANRGDLWAGTGKGLARSSDGGRTWTSYGSVPQFARPGIFALATKGDTIWCSTGYDETNDQGTFQTGSGYAYSLDNGATWNSRPQALDGPGDSVVPYGRNRVPFLPIVVPEQNVTFDISLSSSQVWIASWSSGLRHSNDLGLTWQRVVLPVHGRTSVSPTDSLGLYRIDPRDDNNLLMFSVYAQDDSTIWAGSAGGINKSTDGGISWTNLTSHNQAMHIAGNWVIAIAGQPLGSATRIWATDWIADTADQYGVSCSDDGGRSWKNFLTGVKAYAFAFKDTIAYVAAETGLYRTGDGGLTWQQSGSVNDRSGGTAIGSPAFFSVCVIGDTVYGGTGDGLASTIDNATHPFGRSWQVLRSYAPLASTASTYFYPNPFSPRTDVARVHYATAGSPTSVTIELFDFGMNRVRTLLNNAQRTGSGDHDEIWDGRTDRNTVVPNGVYFYRVIMDGGNPVWGKIMVIQ